MQSRRTGKLPNNSYTTTILFSPEVGLQPKDFDTWKKDVVKICEVVWRFCMKCWMEAMCYLTTLMTHRNCLLMATNNTHTSLLKPDVMHNYTFFMPSSETWEKAFFVPINHLVVINDKSGHFPLSFMNDENQLGTVVWKLVMCLRFITRVILPSFRSDLIFYLAKKIKLITKQNLFSGSTILKNH